MTTQLIKSEDISVDGLFQSFYCVPDYQREYVWGTNQVEQLLTDIYGEMSLTDPNNAPEYFIGSIVVCPGEGGLLDLIDGQQRMTTVYIMLCAIRDRLHSLGEDDTSDLDLMIASSKRDASGIKQHRYRLDLQYKDSGDALVDIANKRAVEGQLTKSMSNIVNTHKVICESLEREFDDNVERISIFYGYLINKVRLIRIKTEDVAKALKIFETINDRGVGLNSMDLLKNLLFMKASQDQFTSLSDQWKRLQDTIFAMKEKPLRFLRYFVFSQYDVDLLREDEIYTWFSKNEPAVGYAKNPVGLVEELLKAATVYKFFREGKDQQGQPNRYLENMRFLGGQAARQHLILLMAGRHLDRELFDRLSQEVENLFFCYVITRAPTRDFERNFASWASRLKEIKSAEELSAFIASTFSKEKGELSGRFDDAMNRLSYGSLQLYRLRYVLAKLSQSVELQAYGENGTTCWLKNYVDGGFEIEHIFPQTPSAKALEEFGEISDPTITQNIGNLVLLEKSINGSLGASAYSEKSPVYAKSKLLLTKSLAERLSIGANTRIDRAVSSIEPYSEWNEENVLKRQSFIASLARDVWEMPEADPTS